MEEEDEFLSQVLAGISQAEVVTLFFPLLRRAIVVDSRRDEHGAMMVQVMPLVSSMEERIRGIEKARPSLGKVRSILGIPWMKSVRRLNEQGVSQQLVFLLAKSGMSRAEAESVVGGATQQLLKLEEMSFTRMIRGEGFRTIWAAQGR